MKCFGTQRRRQAPAGGHGDNWGAFHGRDGAERQGRGACAVHAGRLASLLWLPQSWEARRREGSRASLTEERALGWWTSRRTVTLEIRGGTRPGALGDCGNKRTCILRVSSSPATWSCEHLSRHVGGRLTGAVVSSVRLGRHTVSRILTYCHDCRHHHCYYCGCRGEVSCHPYCHYGRRSQKKQMVLHASPFSHLPFTKNVFAVLQIWMRS